MSHPVNPRLAIIGCGAVVEHHLLPALRRIGWLPSVLIDPSDKRVALLASLMGSKGKHVRAGSDWKSLLDDYDAAIVAAPHALHGPIGRGLAASGKHVFVEKPLAIRHDDCRAMIEAAEQSKTVLAVGLLRRYLKVARWTKALLEQKLLGQISHCEVREGLVFNWAVSSDSLLRLDSAGGGVLMDTGAHTLDLLLWWLGEVDRLSYRDDSQGGVEADCDLKLHFASGATAHVELSRTRSLRNAIHIQGSKGFVEVHLYKNEVLGGSPHALSFRHDGFGPPDMRPQFFAELFDAELKDFYESVRGKVRKGVSGEDGAKSVELIERCYRSRKALHHPWSKMPDSPRSDREAHILPPRSRVLVTGATGFIGGAVVERLVRESKAQVRCFVRNIGRASRLARLPVDIVRGDFQVAEDVESAVKDVDYVIHCAYDSLSRKVNLDGATNLIAACGRNSVRRLVHVSTFSVYEPFPDGPLTEDTADGDRSWVYVQTKLDLEHLIFEMAPKCGVPATIVQPSIVYGPFGKSWTDDVAEMLLYGVVVLPTRPEGICNAVYIDDLVGGLLLAAGSSGVTVERFIMAGAGAVSWTTFFNEFADALRTAPPQLWAPEQIIKSQSQAARDLRRIISDPRQLVRSVARWPRARRLMQGALDGLPTPLRTLVMEKYYRDEGRPLGGTFLPDRQKLALYTSRALATSLKARTLLGYEPKTDFRIGMALTGDYLRWAYHDIRRSTLPADSPGNSEYGTKELSLAE